MPYTGDAKREYQRNWIAKRRQAWIDDQGGSYALCGSTDNLEVDHIDPKLKLCEPAAIWSRNQAFRDAELAKCQVLCGDHHKEKTARDKMPPHGTHSRYNHHKCRCADCTRAHAELASKWRAAGKSW